MSHRVAVLDKDSCHSRKCNLECISFCPVNKTGSECIVLGEDAKAVISEELFWRSGGWTAEVGPVWGSALAYAAAQLPTQNPLLVMGALPLGLVTTWVRRRSGSLLPVVICHLVFSEMTLAWPGLPLPHGATRATEP